ncbi:MAG: DUF1735 domain-containing protein [Rikenellaceae bacterium]|nr:DUF1735 domain-containing protein [Rikenellaceae bacterium]
MKNILILSLTAAALCTSCEDNRKQSLTPDMVYLVKNGFNVEETPDLGQPVQMQLWANKSGLNGSSCRVTFALDPDGLAVYNDGHGTAYEMLPEDCYSVSGWSFAISGHEQYAKLPLVYYPERIVALCGDVYGTEKYAIALKITAEGLETTENDRAIFLFRIKKPDMKILTVDPAQESFYEGEQGMIVKSVEVGTDFVCSEDYAFTVEEGTTALQAIVESYNTGRFIPACLAPADAYTLTSAPGFKVVAGKSKTTITVTVDKSKLLQGINLIPVKLSGVQGPLIVGDVDLCCIPIMCYPDRTDWAMTGSGHHADVRYAPKGYLGMYDRDFLTPWRALPADQNPTLVIDLGKEMQVGAVEFWTRVAGSQHPISGENNIPRAIKTVDIFVGTSADCWSGIGSSEWGSSLLSYNWQTDNPQNNPIMLKLAAPVAGRYVKIAMTKTSNQTDIYELFVYGPRP